ncbi:MAG TPA: hypothetical protein PKX92_10380 [Edaphocola sp.]|nr:hypothetical protein [Edaphocola sp.]
MGTNIFANNDTPLDSYNPNDPYSAISREAISDNVLQADGGGNTDNLEGGYYYKVDGEYLGKEGRSQNVFLADKKIVEDVYDKSNKKVGEKIKYINPKPLNVKNSFLVKKAATTFAEGSQPYGYKDMIELSREAFTISRIHYNYPHIKAYGETAPEAKRFEILSEEKRNGGYTQICIGSVIQSILGQDITNGSTHWDGADILCGRGSYGWDATKHQKQKPEGNYKGISDPNELANDFYNKWKNHLEHMLSLPNLNKNVKADFQAKYNHLKPLNLYVPEYDDKGKLKYQPLYEIRTTYALTLFYKKINFK